MELSHWNGVLSGSLLSAGDSISRSVIPISSPLYVTAVPGSRVTNMFTASAMAGPYLVATRGLSWLPAYNTSEGLQLTSQISSRSVQSRGVCTYHPVGLFPLWHVVHPLVHQVVEVLRRGRAAHQVEVEGEVGAGVRVVAVESHSLFHRGIRFRHEYPGVRNSAFW